MGQGLGGVFYCIIEQLKHTALLEGCSASTGTLTELLVGLLSTQGAEFLLGPGLLEVDWS